MDVGSSYTGSDSQDVDGFHEESSASKKQCSRADSCHGLVNDLENNPIEFLHVEDVHGNTSDEDAINDVEGCVEHILHQTNPGQRALGKCATFPYPGKSMSSAPSSDEDEELETALQRMFSEDSMHLPYSRSISLPTPMKLLSAMKGSREKQGVSPMKLTVTWAPDVYDPPPTILSHTVRGKKQQKSKNNNNSNSKKNGKKGQKGNSARGGSGKDKKQFRKVAGSSDRCYKSLDARDRLVDHSDDLDDFDVGSPESYCGSSFLKKSLTKLHFSVAEAL